MRHFLIREHYYFGWGLFAVVMLVFFVLARRLPSSPQPSDEAIAPQPGGFSYAGIAAACVAMIIGPAWSLAATRPDAEHVAVRQLPTDPAGWRGPLAASESWQPDFPGADAQQRAEYRRAADVVEVYVATYASQRQGKELVGFDNSILDKHQDALLAERRVTDDALTVNEIETDRSGRSALIWYRYEIGSRYLARGIAAQLQYAVASLAGAPTSRLVALRTDCGVDCGAARSRLAELLQTLQQPETAESVR
jgi:EpsI family protein